MKIILREIVGENDPDSRPRLLPFKEFCQYVYEPSQRIKSLNKQGLANQIYKIFRDGLQSFFIQ